MSDKLRTIAIASAFALAAGIAGAVAGSVSTSPPPAFVTDTSLTGDSSGDDISGPCDEAEHANDPRCTGSPEADDDATPRATSSPRVSSSPRPSPSRSADDDISGPCDEPEHANDPRCTGEGRTDNSGPGSANSGRDDDDDDDNSGSGSDGDRSGKSSDDD